ncbi:MAG: hypothetical protein CL424_07775 [Acidimicrobiaceae bacterium]|nr:hypothetical protein [Acidimicrobiaceae bacterium]
MTWQGPDLDMRARMRQRAGLRRFALSDPECDHGLTMSTCTICNGTDRRREREADQASKPRRIDAKFPGTCASCELPIEPGDPILWSPGRKPLHEECTL